MAWRLKRRYRRQLNRPIWLCLVSFVFERAYIVFHVESSAIRGLRLQNEPVDVARSVELSK